MFLSFRSKAVLVCLQDEIERQGSVLVDYTDLIGDQTVCKALPDIITDLKEQPEVMLSCLGVAIHQVNTFIVTQVLYVFVSATYCQ